MDFFKRLSGLPLLFRFRWGFVVLIFIWLGYTIYIPSLLGPFQFDDFEIIVNGVSSQVNLGQLLLSGGRRSVGMFSFQINYLLWGQDPFWYHVVNIFIHICVSLLVIRFCYLLFQVENVNKQSVPAVSIVASLVAGLFFLVHPIQTQAVSYIVQRFASLAALFYLSSLLMFIEARIALIQKKRQKIIPLLFLFSIFFALLAWHTKENSYSLVFAVLLVEICFFQQRLSKVLTAKSVSFFVIAVSVTLIISHDLLKDFLFTEAIGLSGSRISWYHYLITQFSVIVTYLRLIILPLNQNLEHYMPISQSFFEPASMISFSILAGFFSAAVAVWNKSRLVAFGLFFFFIGLSVESSIFPLPDPMYEHRLYLPMIGMAVLVAVGARLAYISLSQKMFWGSLLVLLLVLSYLTYERNFVWSSHRALWEDVVRKNPFDYRGYFNLSSSLEESEAYDISTIVTQKFPSNSMIDIDTYLNNLSVLFRKQGELQKAQYYAMQAYRINPLNSYVQFNILQIENRMFAANIEAGVCGEITADKQM